MKSQSIPPRGSVLKATSSLSPSGYASAFGYSEHSRIDVLANEYIPPGAMIIVVSIEGIFLKVRKLSRNERNLWRISRVMVEEGFVSQNGLVTRLFDYRNRDFSERLGAVRKLFSEGEQSYFNSIAHLSAKDRMKKREIFIKVIFALKRHFGP